MKKSFTLLELIIVISLIAILATAGIALINPIKQFHKSWDGRRKQELSQVQKILEDYYNDKQCYPKPLDVCSSEMQIADDSYTCQICGKSFSPYIVTLPCDPQHSTKHYLYQTDNNTCPTWYRIFTRLSYTADPIIDEVGCRMGCGVKSDPPNFSYNYYVSSPNVGADNCNIIGTFHQIVGINPFRCDTCKAPHLEEDTCDYNKPLYTDANCQYQCGTE